MYIHIIEKDSSENYRSIEAHTFQISASFYANMERRCDGFAELNGTEIHFALFPQKTLEAPYIHEFPFMFSAIFKRKQIGNCAEKSNESASI